MFFFILVMIAFCVVSIQEFVFAEDDASLYEYYQKMVGDLIQDIFEMKNLNGEKNFYLGVTTNNKYGVLYKETLELLEYSQFEEGIIFQEDLIYSGPGNILKEINGKYINWLNNNELYFSEEEKTANSQYIDQSFYNSKKVKSCSLKNKIGKYNVESNNGSQINISPEELFNKKLIHNYKYFLSNPIHGYNRYKECTYVAIQLLLSYNNYVVDRRIIDSQYTYSNINNPYEQATLFLGTNDQYFRKIISVINEIDDCAEFPCEHIKSASLEEKSHIICTLLNEREQIDYTLNTYQYQNIASLSVDIVKSEIDSNRSLIVNISPLLGWDPSSGHSIVAYGYGNYSNGNDEDFGYITHFGWARANEASMYTSNLLSAWINSNWVYQAITLDVKHNHNLVGINNNSNIMTCSSCGCNSVGFTYNETDLYVDITGTISNSESESSIEDFDGCLNIPMYINGKTVIQIGDNAFGGCSKLTIYTSFSSKPSNWIASWNSSNRPIVWGCNLSADGSYVVSVNKTSSTISNINDSEGVTKPYREGYNFGGWYTSTSFEGNQYTDIAFAPNGTLYVKWTEKSSSGGCVTEGTMITLSDGTQRAVEDLSGREQLLVWDIYTGCYASASILFIDSEELGLYNVIELTFNDGTILKIVSEHALWDVTTNKYEFIREYNASFYLGHYFNKGDCIVQLINVEIFEETTKIYSPVTIGHLCYYVNGLLSMPGNTESFINIFEVDANTMTINMESMLQDIATYGLYTYEEFNNFIEISEYIFNAFNGQYLKIALGKGATSFETLEELINMYSFL